MAKNYASGRLAQAFAFRAGLLRIETERVAWASPEPIVARAPWRWVIASDVLYEPRNVDVLLELLPPDLTAQYAAAWADPWKL